MATPDDIIESAVKDAAMQQATDEPTTTAPPMTMDAARAMVARSCAASIAASLKEFRKLKTKTSVEAEDKLSLIRASQELFNTLVAQARKFDRPLVMRPERRIKVVR